MFSRCGGSICADSIREGCEGAWFNISGCIMSSNFLEDSNFEGDMSELEDEL